jgi:integrase
MELEENAIQNATEDLIDDLVRSLAKSSPTLSSLSQEQLHAIAKATIIDDLKDELKQKVRLAKIDYPSLKETFLDRYKSKHTKLAYSSALELLEQYSARAGISILEFKPRTADRFIASLSGSSSSVRLKVAAASSFYTFLDRETDGRVRNPFRGSKVRPKKDSQVPIIPTEIDLQTILLSASPLLQLAITMIVEHGFRIGALPTITIWGGRYWCVSKGKQIAGDLTEHSLSLLKASDLDAKAPWQGIPSDTIRNAFRYHTKKLHREGNIIAPYSVHDLRHYFAVHEYQKDHDIYRLKNLLGHASIQVTETYLQGLHIYT